MLVLSRKIGQCVCINGKLVRIQVVDIRGDKVRLGIDAPKEVTVHREEIQREIDGNGSDG